ncbi:MAG: PEP-CTERM sorting domain-containing protein [Verrucomicrobiales bacterium]|jgi:autotransporter family porin|nr:PEP-CTERM sorting domain-containing protein [Verrucomicrobiales bacterium]
MKTPILKTLTRILTLCALSASALNVFATSKVVTSSTTETGASYDDSDTTTQAALNVTTNGVTYTGTNITLSATNHGLDEDAIGNGAYIDNGASLSLTGALISTSGTYGHGILITNASSGTLNNVNITKTGYIGHGVYVIKDSSLLLTGGTISTSDFVAVGVHLKTRSSGTVNNVTIKTEGENGHGVTVSSSATLLLTGGSITTSGTSAYGVMLSQGNVIVNNMTIETTGNLGHGVQIAANSTLLLTDSDISTTGSNANALNIITSSTVTANLNNNTVTGNILASGTSTITLSAVNGTVITGNVTSTTGATIGITLTGAGTKLVGNVTRDATSEINVTVGANALFHGAGTLDNLTLASGAILGYADDVLLVTDSITIGDNIIIDFSSLTDLGNYQVLDWSDATITGGTVSADQFTIAGDGVEGTFNVDNGKLVFNATAVPEPSTWFLIGLGLGALALIRRRI